MFDRVKGAALRQVGAVKQSLITLLLLLIGLTAIGLPIVASPGPDTEILLYPMPAEQYESELLVTGIGFSRQAIRIELNDVIFARTVANESGDFAAQIELKPGINRLRAVGDAIPVRSVSALHRINYIPAPAAPYDHASSTEIESYSPAAEEPVITAVPVAPVLTQPASTSTTNPITISGTALAGSTLTLVVNGKATRSIVVPASGAFSTWLPILDGLNSIYATAKNADGTSPASNTVQVTYTNNVPRTQSGTISQNTVWTAGNGTAYTINGTLTVAKGFTLWLQPGVKVNVSGNYRIVVQGGFVVRGTSTARAVLRPTTTSCTDTSTERQDWLGVEAQAGTTLSIDYAEIRCARSGVWLNGVSGAITNSRLLGNYHGVYTQAVASARTAPQIKANEFRGNVNGVYVNANTSPTISTRNVITANEVGVYVYGNEILADNPAPIVSGNSIYENRAYSGADLDNYVAANFASPGTVRLNATGNWWGTTDPIVISSGIWDWSDDQPDGYGDRPVVDYSGYLNAAGGTSAFTGGVLNGTLTADQTLAAGDHQLQGSVVVPAGRTLTLQAGAKLTVPSYFKLRVEGTLKITGTSASHVLLRPSTTACTTTSINRKDWQGIVVMAGGTATIDYADIHCAYIGVDFAGGGTVKHSLLRSGNYGIYVRVGSSPGITTGNVITANGAGVHVYGNDTLAQNPAPIVTGNSIYENRAYSGASLDNYTAGNFGSPDTVRLNATGNWWGTTDPIVISGGIWDWSDDQPDGYSDRPVVDYSGYLNAAGGTSAFTGGVLNGPLTADRTLAVGNHQLQGSVIVPTGKTLTLQAGAKLTVPNDFKLQVAGTLKITGTATSRVLLRPATTACTTTSINRDDWQGIVVTAGATATIDYADIYCAAIGIDFAGTGTVKQSSMRYGGYGVYVRAGSSPSITTGNVITANGTGVQVYGNDTLAQNPAPIVTGNNIYENRAYSGASLENYSAANFGSPDAARLNAAGNWWGSTDPAAISGGIWDWTDDQPDGYSDRPVVDYKGYLNAAGGTSAYTGETLNGPITASRTLTAAQLVLGSVRINPSVVLTVNAGVKVTVPADFGMQVQGELKTLGSSTSRVVFRPSTTACHETSTKRDDWRGIQVLTGATATIDYAEIHCAYQGVYFNGGGGSVKNTRLWSNVAALVMTAPAGTPLISANDIRRNEYGIELYTKATPQVTGGNIITANEYGILVNGGGDPTNPAPVVTGNSLYENSQYNYYAYNFETPGTTVLNATGNWWGTTDPSVIAALIFDRKNNAESPTVDFAKYLNGPGGTPAYSGQTLNGTIAASQTLPAGDHQMLGDVTVPAGVTLTFAAGAKLKSVAGRKLRVAGTLVATGSSTSRVVFDSAARVAAKGDWAGIEVLSGGQSTLKYVRLQHATNGVDFNGGGGTIQNSLIRYNTNGIVVRAKSSPSINTANEVSFNDIGVYVVGNTVAADNPMPQVTGNNLYGNSRFNYYALNFGNAAATTLTATGNWWGTTVATEIATGIYDRTDNASSPLVDSASYRTAAAGTLAIRVTDVLRDGQPLKSIQIQPLSSETAGGTYSISRAATVTLQIRRESDNAITYQSSQSRTAAGTYTFAWNGKHADGTFAASALYRIVLVANDGLDEDVYDALMPDPVGAGNWDGQTPTSQDPYRNRFYTNQINTPVAGLFTLVVQPLDADGNYQGAYFYAFKDRYYPAGPSVVTWDGRGLDSKLVTQPIHVWLHDPNPVRPNSVYVQVVAPQVSGGGAAPSIEVKADPYLVMHSYEQITRMAYRLSHDAVVRFVLLPPGVSDPNAVSAIVLVNNVTLAAKNADGTPKDHTVEWRGYGDPLDPAAPPTDPNAIRVTTEGAYTFAIQAKSPTSQQTTLYRGVVNLYQ